MADVRLTATNPEDSSVVPVACNADGRLLIEEQGQGPQGEQGPQGPKGEDGKDGDPFSGNFADDVTFGGSAEVAGLIKVGPEYDNVSIVSGKGDGSNPSNIVVNGMPAVNGNQAFRVDRFNSNGTLVGTVSDIKWDGSATFAGDVIIGGSAEVAGGDFDISDEGNYGAKATIYREPSSIAISVRSTDKRGLDSVSIVANGSAVFAAGKAGFTAEGYLWCTTVRGDTVMLDATSNGMGVWVDYSPNTRIDEIRDKLDANRGDTGEMPTDTP